MRFHKKLNIKLSLVFKLSVQFGLKGINWIGLARYILIIKVFYHLSFEFFF